MPRQSPFFWPGLVTPLFLLGAVLTVLITHGCANNPVASAQSIEQKAYAVYGAFVIAEESAAGIASNSSTPSSVRAAIQSADAKAKPSADALLKAFQDYDAAQSALKAGSTTADKLAIATQNLNQWINTAQSDVNGLVSAIHTQ